VRIPIPLSGARSEGSSLAEISLLGAMVEMIGGRENSGGATFEAASVTRCTRTGGAGGFGGNGSGIFGVSISNDNACGCSKGNAITKPATANCRVIDVTVVHRLLEETSPTRDSTRLSSNIEAPSSVRISGARPARNAAVLR
jgi:hypothetical protein